MLLHLKDVRLASQEEVPYGPIPPSTSSDRKAAQNRTLITIKPYVREALMASEYIKYLTKDIKPEEPGPPPDKKARIKNWFYYHKWHLVVAAVLLIVGIQLLMNALHIGEILPDVQIAYISKYVLSDEVLTVLEDSLSEYVPDANEDGHSTLLINSYVKPADTEGNETLAALSASSTVRLMADLEKRTSFLFLMDDPVDFESGVHILAAPDGTLPPTEDDVIHNPGNYCIPWKDCPVLASLTGSEGIITQLDPATASYLETLYVARRGFWTEETTPHPDECQLFWDHLRGVDAA